MHVAAQSVHKDNNPKAAEPLFSLKLLYLSWEAESEQRKNRGTSMTFYKKKRKKALRAIINSQLIKG